MLVLINFRQAAVQLRQESEKQASTRNVTIKIFPTCSDRANSIALYKLTFPDINCKHNLVELESQQNIILD